MAKSSTGRLVIDDLTGGRNGSRPQWDIADNECVDAVNVDWYRTDFAHRRGGIAAVGVTFSAGGPFTEYLASLFRHVPGTEDTAAEFWAIDNSATPIVGRMAAASTFAAVTLKDAIAGPALMSEASINGKFALAYGSAVNRMHGWDTATVRRFGLAASAAPTAANGGGAGVATVRSYRQRSTRQSAGVTIGRSEPSASVTFTPGANGVTVTQAAVINEGETHWEVEASVDNVTFYRIATVVIATTTYLDNADPVTYNTNPLSAATGTYTLQPSFRYIKADQNRLLGFGAHTATEKQSRVWFSAVIGSLDVGDEERLDTTTNYYIDIDEADSGGAVGLAGPVLGSFFAFKFKQVWRLTATGQVSQPFRADAISKSIGATNHRSIVIGEDQDGNPCLYWMSHRGPYRWGVNGLEYIGRGIEDLILGPTATINITTTDGGNLNHVLFYQSKRQVWFWVPVTDTTGNTRYVLQYDIMRGGWSRFTSPNVPTGTASPDTVWSGARCSVMVSETLGGTMSTNLKPYFGGPRTSPGATTTLFKADTNATDDGTAFQGYVKTKAYEPGGPGFYSEVNDPILLAQPASGVSMSVVVTGDFGAAGAATNQTGSALLTAANSEATVIRRVQDCQLNGLQFYQWTVGDAAAASAAWTLERLVVPYAKHEPAS